MFRKFFNFVKAKYESIKSKLKKYNWKKIGHCVVATVAVVGTAFAVYFGVNYKKASEELKTLKWLFYTTREALTAVSAQCTQLTEDNEILAEMLGRFFGCPGEIYS